MRASAAFMALLLTTTVALAGVPGASAGPADVEGVQDRLGQSAHDGSDGACSIPCGYISPILVIELEDVRGNVLELVKGDGPVELPGTVTFKFDIVQEGFGLHDPSDPITVELRFTNKPDWLDPAADPQRFEVPISPEHVESDPSDPSQPGAEYQFSTDVTVTLEKNSKPILEDAAYEFSRMGLYARSSESGLYKPAYGYREIRFQPVGYEIITDPSQVDAVLADVPLNTGSDDLSIPFHNVQIDMDLLNEITLWQPTRMVFKVQDATSEQVVRHPDMWATVVDEEGDVLYHTGVRHVHNGILTLDYTFPDVGRYTILVTAKPTPSVSQVFWQPVTAGFPVVVQRLGSPSFPDTYNATFYESLKTLSGDPTDGRDQYDKTIPFPVEEGAADGSVSAELGGLVFAAPSTYQPPTFPSDVTVQVLGPDGAVLDEAQVNPAQPSADLSFDASTPGDYALRLVGLGVHPIDYGVGAFLDLGLKVAYDDPPAVTKPNARHMAPGSSEVSVGPVTVSLDRPGDGMGPWEPAALQASVDADGTLKDLIVTVTDDLGRIWYTDHMEATSELTMDFPFPRAGRYLVHVAAEPLAASGARWQAATVTFPVVVGDASQPTVTYPASFEAGFSAQVRQVQADTGTPADQYDRYFPFPVQKGATSAEATVALQMPPLAQLQVELVDGNGSQMAEATLDATSPTATLSPSRLRPDVYFVHVSGLGALTTGYTVDLAASYDGPRTLSNPLYAADGDAGEPPAEPGGLALPGFGAGPALVALTAALAAVAVLARVRRGGGGRRR